MGQRTKAKEGGMTTIAAISVPWAALHPAPWNPRSITEERLQNLCDSIRDDPDFLWRRPVLAQVGYKGAQGRRGRGAGGWFGGNDCSSVFEVPRPKASPDHPTSKPVALIEAMVKNSSRSGDVVLDGFLGSGSTLIACERAGRRCFGLEIDPRYVDVAVRRWETYTGQKAERAS